MSKKPSTHQQRQQTRPNKSARPTLRERFQNASRRQWIWCATWMVLTLLFAAWARSLWVLIVIPFILDIYITKFFPWGFWKRSKSKASENHGVGRRHHIRTYRGLLHQHLLFPKLPDSYFLLRKVAVGRRFPGGQQAQLRAPLAHHPTSFPLAQHTMRR